MRPTALQGKIDQDLGTCRVTVGLLRHRNSPMTAESFQGLPVLL
jgi:hypothetical protein